MIPRYWLFFCAAALSLAATTAGPPHGSLVIVGGGEIGPEILNRFLDLAGGANAAIVVIPTADERNEFPADYLEKTPLRKAGATNLTLLHTRDRAVADSESFVAPLKKARGVFFPGGRQWRLADAYLNTRTERELRAVLNRGGVIGGTSAGATILGSYLVRGAPEGPQIMISPGHERGFGFLRNVAIDQHLLARKRENDMLAVIAAHPELLGIGIDQSTAIVVAHDQFVVLGPSKVAIYDDGKPYYFLSAGDRFDLKSRRITARKPSSR
ncbi:MAG: cyanophycinase [Acidobacteriota bacterium]|nr:cyanophycinase [Acidobacteriota bacterium]